MQRLAGKSVAMPYFTIPALANTDDYRVPGGLAARVVLRDGSGCVYCGLVTPDLEIDHVRPASHFVAGTERSVVNTPSNLVASCESCNNVKGGCGLAGFAEKLRAAGIAAAAVHAMKRRVRAATRRRM